MELLTTVPMWVIIILAAIVVFSIVVMAVIYFKNKSIEQIRTDVYGLILKAENHFKGSKQGMQKMKWVVQQARKLLPKWVQALVSEDALMKIIQVWFDGVKNLLDNGKMD